MRYPTRWQRLQQQTGWPFGMGGTAILLITALLGGGMVITAAMNMWITGGRP